MILDKYKYILFDLDETLLDFEKAEYMAFNKLLEDSDIQFNEELFNKYKEIKNNNSNFNLMYLIYNVYTIKIKGDEQ